MTDKTEMDEWDIKLNKETAGLLYEAMQQIAVRGPQAKALRRSRDCGRHDRRHPEAG